MKVFLYPDFTSKVPEYFQEEDYNIPFLGSTLIDFFVDSYGRFAKSTGNELEILVPSFWKIDFTKYYQLSLSLGDDYEVVFLTSLLNIPAVDFSIEDYQYLVQNPGKFFEYGNGFKAGYINKHSNLADFPGKPLPSFNNLIHLNSDNFLKMNQSLVNNYRGEESMPGFYGLPVVAAFRENIINSKICAPSLIGEDVKIINSVIYPGTVITGNTSIENSEIFESFVCEAFIKNSVVKNSLVALSSVDHVDLEDSVVPKGSMLTYGRKR